ncbi:MAG: carbamoyltransferase [Calditrichaeota bacterium]|nr:MAG: carbamoyltransferase [Calditrichota bacterium]
MAVLSYSNEHEAGAAIVENGEIITAINEERLSRVKNQDGFPQRSIDYVLKNSGKYYNDIDHVIIPEISKFRDLFTNVIAKYPFTLFAKPKGVKAGFLDYVRQFLYAGYILVNAYQRTLREHSNDEARLKKMFPNAKFHRIGHHEAHAASAFYTSGFGKAIIVTADYWGDFITSMISVGNGKELTPLFKTYYPHSLGHFYASLTKWLGFRANRHEGKILGLAAFGNPNSPIYDEIKDLLVVDGMSIKAPLMIGKMWHPKFNFMKNCLMRRLLENHSREDIAAVFQRRFEEVFVELIEKAVAKLGINKVVLAGGAFANVKLNQRIYEVDGVDTVYIFPNMSDGGISQGAALYYDIFQNGSHGSKLPNAYYGPEYNDDEIEAALKKHDIVYKKHDYVEAEIAKVIADNKVVARFNGKMELGPRALGNRSILYQTVDPAVNDWLNKRLKRTEFMPFAPVTLEEFAEKCYLNFENASFAAKFMTITFDCTDYMKENSPATVHIDGTARPQVINETDNPSYYKILKEYHKITGIPSLVNTSFNMHEEPIVCTPDDAIRSFLSGNLDYLAIGSFMVKWDEQNDENKKFAEAYKIDEGVEKNKELLRA